MVEYKRVIPRLICLPVAISDFFLVVHGGGVKVARSMLVPCIGKDKTIIIIIIIIIQVSYFIRSY